MKRAIVVLLTLTVSLVFSTSHAELTLDGVGKARALLDREGQRARDQLMAFTMYFAAARDFYQMVLYERIGAGQLELLKQAEQCTEVNVEALVIVAMADANSGRYPKSTSAVTWVREYLDKKCASVVERVGE